MVQQVTLNVQGMSCGKCSKAVEDSVGAVTGVTDVSVNLGDAQVAITFDEAAVTIDTLKEAIEEQGYDVV